MLGLTPRTFPQAYDTQFHSTQLHFADSASDPKERGLVVPSPKGEGQDEGFYLSKFRLLSSPYVVGGPKSLISRRGSYLQIFSYSHLAQEFEFF